MIRLLLAALLLAGCGEAPQVCSQETFEPAWWTCGTADGGPTRVVTATIGIGEDWSPKVFNLTCTTELDAGTARFVLRGDYCGNIVPWNGNNDPVFFRVACDIPQLGDWQIQSAVPYSQGSVTRTQEGHFCRR